mmetsp:Transcript_118124/g.376620  ORF Transcript_118124/g.376620 Transcript_118124/m.376620 type:complete len:219 (-) Transcript_118124:1817-2473(-)
MRPGGNNPGQSLTQLLQLPDDLVHRGRLQEFHVLHKRPARPSGGVRRRLAKGPRRPRQRRGRRRRRGAGGGAGGGDLAHAGRGGPSATGALGPHMTVVARKWCGMAAAHSLGHGDGVVHDGRQLAGPHLSLAIPDRYNARNALGPTVRLPRHPRQRRVALEGGALLALRHAKRTHRRHHRRQHRRGHRRGGAAASAPARRSRGAGSHPVQVVDVAERV